MYRRRWPGERGQGGRGQRGARGWRLVVAEQRNEDQRERAGRAGEGDEGRMRRRLAGAGGLKRVQRVDGSRRVQQQSPIAFALGELTFFLARQSEEIGGCWDGASGFWSSGATGGPS